MRATINQFCMAFDYRCFFCFNRAFERLLKKEQLTTEQANDFTGEMMQLYPDGRQTLSTHRFARKLHIRLKKYTSQSDVYVSGKKQSNDLVLSMYPSLKEKVASASDPFEVALRLAIAGNIIDFAVNDQYNLEETINLVLNSDFGIDHSRQLKEALQQAKTVLYLGDNNGEIVFDKLFIETINHPNLTFAVRGAPIINDATLEDAIYVGMDKVVPVVSNGYDAPSTLLEHCSAEFRDLFNKADLIISKGQGNLEGLIDHPGNNLFFLLMVKCEVIAERLHVPKGSFVVRKNRLSH